MLNLPKLLVIALVWSGHHRVGNTRLLLVMTTNDALAYSRRKPWETIISSTLVASIYIAQLI
jgi:hypothetical protein